MGHLAFGVGSRGGPGEPTGRMSWTCRRLPGAPGCIGPGRQVPTALVRAPPAHGIRRSPGLPHRFQPWAPAPGPIRGNVRNPDLASDLDPGPTRPAPEP